MKKEDLIAKIKGIGESSSIEDARTLLVDFQKELEKDYDDHDLVLNERNQLKTDNESLRQANMKLFLQVGSDDPQIKKPGSTNPENKNNELKYEDLFDDKGGIK